MTKNIARYKGPFKVQTDAFGDQDYHRIERPRKYANKVHSPLNIVLKTQIPFGNQNIDHENITIIAVFVNLLLLFFIFVTLLIRG